MPVAGPAREPRAGFEGAERAAVQAPAAGAHRLRGATGNHDNGVLGARGPVGSVDLISASGGLTAL